SLSQPGAVFHQISTGDPNLLRTYIKKMGEQDLDAGDPSTAADRALIYGKDGTNLETMDPAARNRVYTVSLDKDGNLKWERVSSPAVANSAPPTGPSTDSPSAPPPQKPSTEVATNSSARPSGNLTETEPKPVGKPIEVGQRPTGGTRDLQTRSTGGTSDG